MEASERLSGGQTPRALWGRIIHQTRQARTERNNARADGCETRVLMAPSLKYREKPRACCLGLPPPAVAQGPAITWIGKASGGISIMETASNRTGGACAQHAHTRRREPRGDAVGQAHDTHQD